MTEFEGFPTSGLELLTALGAGDKSWFDANRSAYDLNIAAPAKLFVVALGDELRKRMSAGIEAQPKTNGSIAPINNDLRFSPDASPYKDHLMFRFWEGPTKKTAPTLMVRVSPTDGIGFATGLVIADLDRWRTVIDDDERGTTGAAAIAALIDATKADLVGEGYKKVPKPFSADHPRAHLLRHKGLQIRWVKATPKQISAATFAGWCADELARAGDVHHWLVRNFAVNH